MRVFLFTLLFSLAITFTQRVYAQGFPNPALMSTGQGPQGSLDPIWLVSGWFNPPIPNPLTETYTSALISNNCAPGYWIVPSSLPPPVNNGNWITNPHYPCSTNTIAEYMYFRLTITLPPTCGGVSIDSVGTYSLSLSGYVDNLISDVYVNGVSTGFNGGGYSAGTQLNFTLTGPWVAGTNYIDVLLYNRPLGGGGGGNDPYGLLLVANTSGTYPTGCAPTISGDTVICPGDSTWLWVPEPGYTYRWSTGATTDSIRVGPSSTTIYSVTVTNVYGYMDSTITHVVVSPLPPVTIAPRDTSICVGDSAVLTASGGVSYLWSTTAATDAITVSLPIGNTRYTVTATGANSCSDTASAIVTVHPLPTPSVSLTPAQICGGYKDTLIASGGVSYAWSNGANTDTTIVSPLIDSTYTVTVTDANSCSATATGTVTVNPAPTAIITPTSTQICIGNKDTLTTGLGASYVWSNGANTVAIIVSPLADSTYTVTVTDANTCSATASNTVIVNALPSPTISLTSLQICGGYKDTLIARGGVNYAWNNGANTDTTIVSPLTDSTYTVTVTNANTCSAAATATVTVNPSPTPSITPTSAQICIGNSDTLTAGGGGSYAWSNAATTAITIVSPLVDSTYTVTVTGANTCSASDSITVIVNPLPTPVITLTSALICSGNKDTLIAGGGISYAWSSASNTDTTIVSPATTTIYTVTVTDAQSCSDTASQTVIVNPLPPVTISPAAAQICLGSGTTLTATGGGSYVWSNGSNTDTTTVAPATTTAYSVTVTANSCTASATDIVTVIPVPTLSVGPDTVICARISYNIPGVTTATSIIWSPDSGLSNANIVAPTFHYNDSVNFTYTVIAYDTPSGCADTVYLNIGMSNCVSYIEGPEAFSPNNDGINDFYTLFSSQIAKYDIRIYNRWGEMVYESTDLSALNDISKGWDGTYHGKPQPLGVFVYYINATDTFNKQISHKGNITLIR